jgi:hypothetical protein
VEINSQSTNKQAGDMVLVSIFCLSIETTTPRSIKSDELLHKTVWDIQKEINAQYEAESRTSTDVTFAVSLQKVKPPTRTTI